MAGERIVILDSLLPAVRGRFERTWDDPEVSLADCMKRFGFDKSNAAPIAEALGRPKARLGSMLGEAAARRDRDRQRMIRAARRARR